MPRTFLSTLEEDKDLPSIVLNGLTYREVQIRLFKDFIEPCFGSEAMGEFAIRGIMNIPAKHVTVSDAGISKELIPILNHFGRDNG